jgi:hypothetical protein
VYNDKHFYRIIIRHWKKTFKKCNSLIIIFFSQIAQATTFEKFNVTCFPRGWHYKNISFCSLKWNVACFPRIIFPDFFSNRNVWNTSLLVFRVSFSCTCLNRNVWNTSLFIKHFPVLFQKQNHFRHRSYFLQFYFLSIFTINTTACYSF